MTSHAVLNSYSKGWLHSDDKWYPTQARSAKPATHTFMCGGVAVLHTEAQYIELYIQTAKDIVENKGLVCMSESFPRITGSWPASLYPPPHLLRRAIRARRFDEVKLPSYLLDSERFEEDRMVNGEDTINKWNLCAFAMDLDFGQVETWFIDDIICDVRVIQRVILECGRYTNPNQSDIATCIICVGYDKGKLGVHLHFPNTRYYPEECMHLATVCVSRLQEERPVMPGCSRTWYEILDMSIFDKWLRIPMVQKAKKCPVCENNPRKKKQCKSCSARGIVWDDRRYYPIGTLDGNGQWRTNEDLWMDPMVDHIRGPGEAKKFRDQHTRTTLPIRNEWTAAVDLASRAIPVDAKMSDEQRRVEVEKSAQGVMAQLRQPRKIADAVKCREFVICLLLLCSLRINSNDPHTLFRPTPIMPRPTYPRSWIHFFESVIHAAAPPPSTGLSLGELERRVKNLLIIKRGGRVLPVTDSTSTAMQRLFIGGAALTTTKPVKEKCKEELDAQLNAVVTRLAVVKLQPTPYANPGGDMFTTNHTMEKDDRELIEQRHAKSKFSHLLLTHSDDIQIAKKMGSGIFGEYRDVETICNDPEGRCKRLQAYLRSLPSAPQYNQIQVLKIHISLKFKNHLVQVGGPGRHYCHIARRNHRNCVISFQVLRVGQALLQHCFHPKCSGQHYNFGSITNFDIRVLFAPNDTLKECEKNTPAETVALAKNLQLSSKAHSTAAKKRNRRKSTVEAKNETSFNNISDEPKSLFGPNAPPPIQLPQPKNKSPIVKKEPQDQTKQDKQNMENSKEGVDSSNMENLKQGVDTACDGGETDWEDNMPESPCSFSDLEDDVEEEEEETDAQDPDIDDQKSNNPKNKSISLSAAKLSFNDALEINNDAKENSKPTSSTKKDNTLAGKRGAPGKVQDRKLSAEIANTNPTPKRSRPSDSTSISNSNPAPNSSLVCAANSSLVCAANLGSGSGSYLGSGSGSGLGMALSLTQADLDANNSLPQKST